MHQVCNVHSTKYMIFLSPYTIICFDQYRYHGCFREFHVGRFYWSISLGNFSILVVALLYRIGHWANVFILPTQITSWEVPVIKWILNCFDARGQCLHRKDIHVCLPEELVRCLWLKKWLDALRVLLNIRSRATPMLLITIWKCPNSFFAILEVLTIAETVDVLTIKIKTSYTEHSNK